MEFEIVPLVGALPLKFGMTKAQVEKILGPSKSEIDMGDEIQVSWSQWKKLGLPIKVLFEKKEGGLSDIQFEPGPILKYDKINLFDQKDIIKFLSNYEKAQPVLDVIVFPSLEISVSKSKIKNISIAKKGRWEPILEQLKEMGEL